MAKSKGKSEIEELKSQVERDREKVIKIRNNNYKIIGDEIKQFLVSKKFPIDTTSYDGANYQVKLSPYNHNSNDVKLVRAEIIKYHKKLGKDPTNNNENYLFNCLSLSWSQTADYIKKQEKFIVDTVNKLQIIFDNKKIAVHSIVFEFDEDRDQSRYVVVAKNIKQKDQIEELIKKFDNKEIKKNNSHNAIIVVTRKK